MSSSPVSSVTFVASGYVPLITHKGHRSAYTHVKCVAGPPPTETVSYLKLGHRSWTMLSRDVRDAGVEFPKAAFKKLTEEGVRWFDAESIEAAGELEAVVGCDDSSAVINGWESRMKKSLRLLNAFLSSSLSVSPASIDTFLSSQQTQTTLTVQTGLNYGQYFASDSTCDAITSLLSRYLSSQNPSQPLTLIEPSCGTGELLTKGTQGNIISALLSCPLKNVSIKCVDLDATVLPICEESVGKLLRGVDDDKGMTVEYLNGDFLKVEIDGLGGGGEIITICGPPYGPELTQHFIDRLTVDFKVRFGVFILPVRMKGLEIEGYEVDEICDVEDFEARSGRMVKQPSFVVAINRNE
ncbi:hypothetical protein TrVE_jg10392 [Triparma verrucosa]|uniref:Uncharacterized protein n=1 Tax=Triparma verrucosa TaxID=1606542 RepID=A0A9W7FCA3_9STRA|nr:hypothetical protein TrVE_jg10392 [Triparma verrucosa]